MINIKQVEERFRPTDDGKQTFAQNGMVSSASEPASQAGAQILKKGGNAVDSAIATALALAVTEPQASGLGGQTMMLISQKNKVMAIDGSSRAPSLAHPSSIYKTDRSLGYRASTVPSTPATLWYVHNRYGKLPWKSVIEPAIRLAENGVSITKLQHKLQLRELEKFLKVPSKSGAKYFLKNDTPYNTGDIFKQPDLSKLLIGLSDKGIEEFYRGKIAKQIDADMRENGGLLRYDDLALIPFPIERRPLKGDFRGLSVYTMPPPGSGRTLVFALMMLDLIPPENRIKDEATWNFLLIKILRKAFLERSDRPFDPNFFPQIARETDMLAPRFAKECLNEIIGEMGRLLLPLLPTEDELTGETTHLSVIDKNGMAVSLTQSIERVYGSKAAADGLGFLYNNYLFDYEYNMPEHPFYLRPNNPPWATVTPSLVFNNKEIWMAIGSPGSERIISVLVQFLFHLTDEGMSIGEAMKAPRLHCSLGGRVSLESERFPESLIPYLKHKGLRIDEREAFSFYLGCLQAVLKCHDNSGFQGIADVRRDGTAVGI